ncbi:MAG: hypothetical protein K9N51_11805, partial [Candidatus Pacebacteria bacterium]|nr:hypothetical protein [Candidatus Paceibacterota bacterium]
MSQNCGQLTSMDEESLSIVIGTCREGFGTKGMARLVRRLAESDEGNCAEFLLMGTVEEIPESEDRLALLEQLEFTDGQSRLKGRVSQLVGEIKTSLGEFRQASEHLRRARELQPADPRVWNSLANLTLDSQGDPLKAREYAKKAVALSEDAEARVRGACLMTLGRVLQRMGLTYPARTNFARSVAVYETAENRLHLGSILLAREVRDPNAAVELKRAETLAVLANKEDVLQEVRRLLASMDSAGSEGGKEAAAGDSMPQ